MRVLNSGVKNVIFWLIPFLIISVTSVSCSENSKNKRIGGNFNFCSKNRIHHLHPSLISDESTSLVAHQIFEGLVKLNSKTLRLNPVLLNHLNLTQKLLYTHSN